MQRDPPEPPTSIPIGGSPRARRTMDHGGRHGTDGWRGARGGAADRRRWAPRTAAIRRSPTPPARTYWSDEERYGTDRTTGTDREPDVRRDRDRRVGDAG